MTLLAHAVATKCCTGLQRQALHTRHPVDLYQKLHLCCLQAIAQDCFELLRTAADALKQWSEDVSRHIQQRTPADSKQQPGHPIKSADELHKTVVWLLHMLRDILQTTRQQQLYSAVDPQLLLDTVGQLVRRVS